MSKQCPSTRKLSLMLLCCSWFTVELSLQNSAATSKKHLREKQTQSDIYAKQCAGKRVR